MYICYSCHYIYTCILHTEERKERQNSNTERPGIPPQSPWFFYVPGVQLRYTGPTFYVLIRRTKLGKSCRCLRIHRTHRSGWYSNPVPRFRKSAPLTLSYRGSLVNNTQPLILISESVVEISLTKMVYRDLGSSVAVLWCQMCVFLL